MNEAVATAMTKMETGAKELIKKNADPKTVEFLTDLRDKAQELYAPSDDGAAAGAAPAGDGSGKE